MMSPREELENVVKCISEWQEHIIEYSNLFRFMTNLAILHDWGGLRCLTPWKS